MTLNITMTSPHFMIQVSDRRMVSLDGSRVEDDANKAVLLATSDAVLSITFSGLGRLQGKRVDEALAMSLLEAGIAELGHQDALAFLTEWSNRTFAGIEPALRAQTFVCAGFVTDAVTCLPVPKTYMVSNIEDDSVGTLTGSDEFAVEDWSQNGTVVGGYLPAFDRLAKRHLKSVVRALEGQTLGLVSLDSAERGVVRVVQSIATRHQQVGQRCMAILLTSSGEVRASSYSAAGSAHRYAPWFVWYVGGRNVLVGDVDVLPSRNSVVALGGDPCKFRLIVGSGVGAEDQVDPSTRIHMTMRLGNAVHRVTDAVEEVSLVGFHPRA